MKIRKIIENKRAAGGMTMPKLVSLILALVVIVMVIVGLYTGAMGPLIEQAGGFYDQVMLLLLGPSDDGGVFSDKNLLRVNVLGQERVLNIRDEDHGTKCTMNIEEIGLFGLDYVSDEKKPIFEWYDNWINDATEEQKWKLVSLIIPKYQKWYKQDSDMLNLGSTVNNFKINVDKKDYSVYFIKGGLGSSVNNNNYVFYYPNITQNKEYYVLSTYTDNEGIVTRNIPKGDESMNLASNIKKGIKQNLEKNNLAMIEESDSYLIKQDALTPNWVLLEQRFSNEILNLIVKDTRYLSYAVNYEGIIFRKFTNSEKLKPALAEIEAVMREECG